MISFQNSLLSTIITVDMTVYRELEADRNYIYGRIDQILSNMEDGSDKFITYQISNYIAELITYTNGYRDVIDGVDGKGVCATYAFLYKLMAERVGIRTDIVYGSRYETKDDGTKAKTGHAWNRSSINGKYFYYDITWLDSEDGNFRYKYYYQPNELHTSIYTVYRNDAISFSHYGVTTPFGC